MSRIQFRITATLTALAMTALSVPMPAADPIELPWNQVCRKAADHELVITTDTGETVDGYCVTVNVNEISINVKGKVVKVAKGSVSKLLIVPQRHRLMSLGHGMHDALSWGFRSLFSPEAVFALVAIPATLAWGAVSAPFCLIGDLGEKWKPDQEVRVK